MDGFLKIIGMAIFVIALGAVVILAASTKGAGMAAIVYALPVMVGGAAVYALGAILSNLICDPRGVRSSGCRLERVGGAAANN